MDEERYALFERVALKIAKRKCTDSALHFESKVKRIRTLYRQVFGETPMLEYATTMRRFLDKADEVVSSLGHGWLVGPLLQNPVYEALRRGQDFDLLRFWLVWTSPRSPYDLDVPLEPDYYDFWEQQELLEHRFKQLTFTEQVVVYREIVAEIKKATEKHDFDMAMWSPFNLSVFLRTVEYKEVVENLVALPHAQYSTWGSGGEVFEALAEALCREAGVE